MSSTDEMPSPTAVEATHDQSNSWKDRIRAFETFINAIVSWGKDNKEIVKEFNIKMKLESYKERPEELTNFMEDRKIRINVVGSTSSGKSLYINTLLGKDILKVAHGHTTPCFLEIGVHDDVPSYYQYKDNMPPEYFDFSNKKAVKKFHKKIDSVNPEAFDGRAALYLSRKLIDDDCIVSKDVTIVDCPGMERSEFKGDDAVMIKEADALVLIVNVDSGNNEGSANDILYKCKFFVKPNVIVLINKTDILMWDDDEEDEDEDRERTKLLIDKNIKEMVQFLTRPGGPYKTEEEARNAIFFISARKQRKAQRQRTSSPSGEAGSTAETSERESNQKCFGFRVTDEGYIIDAESLSMAYSDSLESLLSIARHHKDEEKMKRLERDIADWKQEIISTASDVESQLLDVQTKIEDCIGTLNSGEEAIGLGSIFAYHVYFEKISGDEVTGREKLEMFITAIHDNPKLVKSYLLPSSYEQTDERLKTFLDKMFKAAVAAVTEQERNLPNDDFSRRLEPVEIATEIEDILAQFRERSNYESRLLEALEEKKRLEKEESEKSRELAKRREEIIKDLTKITHLGGKKHANKLNEIQQLLDELKEKQKKQKDLTTEVHRLRSEIRDEANSNAGISQSILSLRADDKLRETELELKECRSSTVILEHQIAKKDRKRRIITQKLAHAQEELEKAMRTESSLEEFTSSNAEKIKNLEEEIQHLKEQLNDNVSMTLVFLDQLIKLLCYEKQCLETQREHLKILKDYMGHLMDRISKTFDSLLREKIQELIATRETLAKFRR